ncbi:DMT family transporter [Neisseriaceae bacterium JH1-16]|nr:DMT family transporter [Neisseriaceae bacterium JH1-16]
MSESCRNSSAALSAEQRGPSPLRIVLLTAAAMIAFAANSLLCRLALQRGAIDAASFSSLRLVSGALLLALLAGLASGRGGERRGDWPAGAMLFCYVACFSFAYLTLSAGTGALILFGAVQLTMFVAGLRAGERFRPLGWLGFVLAIVGLVYLVSPGVTAPAPLGAALMAAAGVAWGGYSLRGRGQADPLAATAGNFLRAVPLALALSMLSVGRAHVTLPGVGLAMLSGAVTSGIGYVIWYAALKGLTALRAATVQLSVPPLAALGGTVMLAEAITPRLALTSVAILGGIALVLFERTRG